MCYDDQFARVLRTSIVKDKNSGFAQEQGSIALEYLLTKHISLIS